MRFGLSVLGTVVAAGVLFVIAFGLARYRGVGKLGTRVFRRRYRDVWAFLASTSTDSLHELKATIDQEPDEATRLWNEVDLRFSLHLARLWDAQPPPPSRGWLPFRSATGDEPPWRVRGRFRRHEEVQRLTAQVESFVCRTMLISERTPRLNHFGLPRLTLLYRLLWATRSDVYTHPTPRLVSDFDVWATLGNAGYPPEYWETYLTWERELLDRVKRSPEKIRAVSLRKLILDTGLHHGLTSRQARGVVRQLWTDVQSWRKAAA